MLWFAPYHSHQPQAHQSSREEATALKTHLGMIGHLPGAYNLCGRCTAPSLVPSGTSEHSHRCWHCSSPPLFVDLWKEHVKITELKPQGSCLCPQLLGSSHPSEQAEQYGENTDCAGSCLFTVRTLPTTTGDNKAQNNMLLGFTISADKLWYVRS